MEYKRKQQFKNDLEVLRKWKKNKTITDIELGKLEMGEMVENLILFGVGVTLPNIYVGSLNSKRIKKIDTIAETLNIEKSTVRILFCDGADWYKNKIKDNGN